MSSYYISFGIYKNDIYGLLTASLLALPLFVSFPVKNLGYKNYYDFLAEIYISLRSRKITFEIAYVMFTWSLDCFI